MTETFDAVSEDAAATCAALAVMHVLRERGWTDADIRRVADAVEKRFVKELRAVTSAGVTKAVAA